VLIVAFGGCAGMGRGDGGNVPGCGCSNISDFKGRRSVLGGVCRSQGSGRTSQCPVTEKYERRADSMVDFDIAERNSQARLDDTHE